MWPGLLADQTDLLHESAYLETTDHNTVNGVKNLRQEIEQLEFLEDLGRINYEEKQRLAEYRVLLDKVLLLPGFELTATLGFRSGEQCPLLYLRSRGSSAQCGKEEYGIVSASDNIRLENFMGCIQGWKFASVCRSGPTKKS